mgnify:CR=1 FL=1
MRRKGGDLGLGVQRTVRDFLRFDGADVVRFAQVAESRLFRLWLLDPVFLLLVNNVFF